MGLFDKLRNEFIDIIEWLDDSNQTLVWRFPRYQNEIKQGAQLIVRPGQAAVFVHHGQLADVFRDGTHTLETGNLPLLSTLAGWKHGFDSPFRCEVYFVSTKQLTDLKWGTPNPIMLRDADFGPIRLRAFGTYALKAMDPEIILRELVGTDGDFQADEVTELLRSIINNSFADIIGQANIPALDLAAHYRELSDKLRQEVASRIDDEYGLEIPLLTIVNISLPEAVEKALDTRSTMGVLGDMDRYQQFQMAQALTAAAENPGGGGAAAGLGLGMGMAMANQMVNAMPGAATAAPAAAPPPPPPASTTWHVTKEGQTLGPFSPEQMSQAVQQGQVTATTLVWCQGMAAWLAAGQAPQLAHLFAGPPPPPPPPPPPTGA